MCTSTLISRLLQIILSFSFFQEYIWSKIEPLFTSRSEQIKNFLQNSSFYKGSRRAAHPHRAVFVVYIKHDNIKEMATYKEKNPNSQMWVCWYIHLFFCQRSWLLISTLTFFLQETDALKAIAKGDGQTIVRPESEPLLCHLQHHWV